MFIFDSKKLVDRFNSCKEQFVSIADSHATLLQQIKKNFEQHFSEYEKRGFLSVAFIGEYSAGKSTIISALTGRKDIKISGDIATDTTTEYDWNGIKIIDTPGLFTDRTDHDEITHKKIKESDLLIFTLTHSLFDSITVENFKELAYNYNYKNKMMLVVNKLSSEAGNDEEKIQNYTESLQTAIAPNSLATFPIAFVDALDYLDGVQDDDKELQKLSRFASFADVLNQFTTEKNVYAKLDTPIRILGSALDDAIQVAARDDLGDNAQLELLKRLSKILRREQRRLTGELDSIVLELNNKIQSQAAFLTSILGSDNNFEVRCKDAEREIRKLNEEAASSVEKAIQISKDELWADLSEVFDSDLFKEFVFDANTNASLSIGDVHQRNIAKNINQKAKKFEAIAQTATKTVGDLAVKEGVDVGTRLLKNADVSGTTFHKGVKAVGHFFGHKFVPYEAIKITKAIGNVAKFAGPAIAILTFASDVAQVQEDEENARKLSTARKDITIAFQGIANDMEASFSEQLNLVFREYFQPIEKEIKKVRDSEQQAIAQSNDLVAELSSVRKELDNVLLTVR
jgi:small GTP-binding protein